MSEKRRTMVKVLVGRYRYPRLEAVTALVDPHAFSILDLGTGIGALIPFLKKKAPHAEIVGIDRSSPILAQFLQRQPKHQTSILQGQIPTLPLISECFDVVVAVQFLHEVFHFINPNAFYMTLTRVYELLRKGGQFIIFDHCNPGSTPIDAYFPPQIQKKLTYFIQHFQPRTIKFQSLENGWVRMSQQDFVDFITKLFAFDTDLEEEEMNETHTPYTNAEMSHWLQQAGFHITYNENHTSLIPLLTRFNIQVSSVDSLPLRHLLICGKKR